MLSYCVAHLLITFIYLIRRCAITTAFQRCIWKVQENQVGLKLNGTHRLLAYTDDVNLLGGNIDTIKKNTEP
jgi:hypothetical protein